MVRTIPANQRRLVQIDQIIDDNSFIPVVEEPTIKIPDIDYSGGSEGIPPVILDKKTVAVEGTPKAVTVAPKNISIVKFHILQVSPYHQGCHLDHDEHQNLLVTGLIGAE